MFKRILVANRGEIACRILRTCDRMGIESVAVFSDADVRSPHVALADRALRLGPAPVRESYLNVDALLAVIAETEADAVHPGYGLLSENSAFAEAVANAGATFIGPSPQALEAFGDKIKARAVATRARVALAAGTHDPFGPDDYEPARAAAERIGLPLLVKAAGGGGGIGMQVVRSLDQFERAFKSCSDRGKQAFGDDRVYLERYLDRARHIEVQILRDQHGNAVALGERECSAQRRHQKILEESPSPAGFFQGAEGEARRQKLFSDALAVMAEVGYVGAGTVEFVADPDGNLYFLEVNARLQVEHPVTEMRTGLDLVEQQIRVAAGEPLAQAVKHTAFSGHAIEARLYAEDPKKVFAPQPGKLARLEFPSGLEGVRVDAGFEQGGEITSYYDPLIAKLIAHGPTRDDARARLDAALAATQIELVGPKGSKQTNRDFLRTLIASEPFAQGDYDTHFAEAVAKGQK